MNESFSLLTLNCFGGYLPGTGRRLLALAQALERRDDQVVCLQEIQLNRYLRIMLKARSSFPYQDYEPHFKAPKGGLLTLARTSIKDRQFIPYTERGLWYTPMIMDRILYKGMLITTLEWANIPIIVINTHVLANYVGDWDRYGLYARVEEKQLRQLAATVRAQPAEALILAAGDFNIPRGSKLYHDFLESSKLNDPLAGDTRPTLRLPFGVPVRYALPIDYVMVRVPDNTALKVECDLCFSGREWQNRWRQDYFSDHQAIGIRITKL